MESPSKVLSLHEQIIERHFPRDPQSGAVVNEAPLRVAFNEMAQSRALWEQAQHAFRTIADDTSLELATRITRARKAVTSLAQAATRRLDTARARLEKEIEELSKNNA